MCCKYTVLVDTVKVDTAVRADLIRWFDSFVGGAEDHAADLG